MAQEDEIIRKIAEELNSLQDPLTRFRGNLEGLSEEQKKAAIANQKYTESSKLAVAAVAKLAQAAANTASQLYNGQKGAGAFNGALDGMSGAVQTGTKAFATMFPAAKGVVMAFSLATQAVTAYAKAANVMADGLYKGYQGLAKSGAAASDGMSGLFNDAKKLGLSMSELDDYVRLIGENARDLALFSGSVYQGRQRFADINKMMDGPVKTGLMNLGMSVQEIADGTMGYLKLQTRLGRSQNMTNEQLADGAARYLKEQDALAKVTGQSRKEMEEATERAMMGEQFNAKVRQLQMSGQGEAAEKLIEMNKMYGAMGPKTQAGFQAIVTGNLANKDAQDAFRASQGEMLRSTQRVIAGQQEMGDAVQGTMHVMGETSDRLGTTLGQVGAYDKNFGSMYEHQKGRILSEGNLAENLKKAAKEQEAQGAKGGAAADAMVSNQVKIVQTQIKINEALETFVKDGIEPTQKAMQALANVTLAAANKANDMGPKKVGVMGAAGLGAAGGAMTGFKMGGPKGALIGALLGGLIGGGSALLGAEGMGLPGRSGGSKGATGKLIEDFGKGTPMMLHGREGVITEQQLQEFGNSAMAAGMGMTGGTGKAGVMGAPDRQIAKLIQENRQALDKQVTTEEKILTAKIDYYEFIVSQLDAIELNATNEKKISTEDLKNIKDFSKTRDQLLDDILNNIKQQATLTKEASGATAAAGGGSGASGGSGGGASGGSGGGTAPVAPPGPSAPTEVEGAKGGGPTAKASEVLDFTARSGSASAFEGLDNRVKSATIAAAEQYLAATGKKFQINSAKRDPADQKRLWDESVAAGRPGRGPTGMAVAKPGRSPHEHGLAVDIQNYNDPTAVAAMNRQGLKQKVPGDPVHFSFGDGGIANGPTSGYLAELHGPEAVVPLPDGKSIPVTMPGGDDFSSTAAANNMKTEMGRMMTEFKSSMQMMMEQMNSKAMLDVMNEMVKVQKTSADIQKKMLQAQS